MRYSHLLNLLFVFTAVGCIAEPFPCDRGASPLDSGACLYDTTEKETLYADKVVEDMGGDEYHYLTHIRFLSHHDVNELYTQIWGEHTSGRNVAGFNQLEKNSITCVRDSLPHELGHSIIWIDSGGIMSGKTHEADSGWTEEILVWTRAVLETHGPILRDEPQPRDIL